MLTGLDLGTIYMLATVAVCGLCWIAKALTREADDVFAAAAVILFLSSMTAVVRDQVGHPWSLAVHPVQDAVLVWLFAGAYQTTRARWAIALTALFTIQLCIHAGFWITAWATGDLSAHAQRGYIERMNGVFILVLATLTVAAGGYVVRYRRRNVADLPRLGGLASLGDHRPGREA